MKICIPILLLFVFNVVAQKRQHIIDATTDKNVFLFFPSPIIKALPGNNDFHFAYNQQTAENFGILKAATVKGESTLHVITKDQSVYSFLVRYNPSTEIFEHFFDGSEAVGNKGIGTRREPGGKPRSKTAGEGEKVTDSDFFEDIESDERHDFQFCRELLSRKPYFKSFYRKKSDIVLRMTNIAYKKDRTYICIKIENNSTVDYDLNFIQFNKIAKKASKKSNYQAIEIKPIPGASFQAIERIPSKENRTAIYVFEKISIDRNKLVNIEINELKGERNLNLGVGDQYINNPNK